MIIKWMGGVGSKPSIRGREKRDTEVWMLISINAIDDDED